MVLGSLDMTINSDFGNSAFCTLESDEFVAGTLLLEAIFTIKCPAPKALQLGRYLNHSYLRIVTDENSRNYHEMLDEDTFNSLAGRIPKATAQELIRHARPKINDLIAQAKQLASKQQTDIIEQAVATMHQSLQPEQDRLTALAKVNSSIRQEEIQYIADSQHLLAEYLTDAQLSLDAVRVAIVTA
jgi:ATP-dependent helicase HepA